MIRVVGALWAVVGFSLLLIMAINRLGAMAVDGLSETLGWPHWLALTASVVFMAYSEGYRGFQQKFSPRFASRVVHIRQQGSVGECILAPFYAMGFFNAPRRVMITSYLLTSMIVVFVLTFNYIPQPWRGVLDAGVVVGLLWGLLVSWWWVAKTWPRGRPMEGRS